MMNFFTKSLLILSITIIVISIIIGIFPFEFRALNNQLSYSSNLFSYLGMLFAAFALLIASLAYKVAILRPKLNLIIWPWMGEENSLTLLTNKDTRQVPSVRPNTSLHFRLENNGQATAKYPVVEIIFKDAFFLDSQFPGWEPVYHANALGWYGFRWDKGNSIVIHPGLPILLPVMYFVETQIDEPLEIDIKIVADGFDKHSYTLPVKIEYVDFE